ncbi:MAG: glycosyltransferase family 2 protein [Ethanoligenens sp.]
MEKAISTPKIIFYMQAYNAEKTISRAIKSILNQSYKNWICYCADNGSVDHTGDIIAKYAQKHNKIQMISLEKNNRWYFVDALSQILNCFETGYYSNLDADDEYSPVFLEKMLQSIDESQADIVACGNDVVDATTGHIISVQKLQQNIILKGLGRPEQFVQYFPYACTIWGKLYSLSVLRKCNFDNVKKVSYGGDTIFAMEAFRNANCVSIIAKSLHKYYISHKSVSYQFDEKRIVSNRIFIDTTREFLVSAYGSISQENQNYLFGFYLNAITNTIFVMLNANINVIEKLDKLRDIFQDTHTQELVKWNGMAEQKSNLFRQILQWVLSQPETTEDKGLNLAADLFATLHLIPSNITGWPVSRTFILLTKIKAKCDGKELSNHVSSQILSIASKSPFLAKLSMEFLNDYGDIVVSLLQKDKEEAWRDVQEALVRQDDLSVVHSEELLTLGLNLSASLNRTDDFIAFKKKQIAWLLEVSRPKDAWEELDDWDKIMPDDADFKSFRNNLENRGFEIHQSPSN